MDKLKMHSPNLTQDNIARIRDLFPGCVTEAKGEDGNVKLAVDFDQLRQELADSIVEGPQERYHLNWPGKREAMLTANAPIAKTLRPVRTTKNSKGEQIEESVNFDTTKNIFIEGDNLDALKLLQETYLGKIKMVYIDPPYNTGNDFVYADDFADEVSEFFLRSNQVDSKGNRLTANPETSGRFHSDWLSMMYSRLKLSRNLLRDDGLIVIHIDENEYPNLEKLLAEIYGEKNNLGTIVWDKRNPKGDATGVAQQHELICIYCKDREFFKATCEFQRPKENAGKMLAKAKQILGKEGGVTEKARKEYKDWVNQQDLTGGEKAYNQIDDNGDVFRPVSMAWPNKKKAPEDYFIPLIHPVTGKECPVPERGWRNPPATMQELLKSGLIIFGSDEKTQPTRKYRLKDNLFENIPSLLYYGGSDDALLADLNIPFDTPKPVQVAKRLIQSICKNDDILIDFFAGSCTAAHALMLLNAEDGANRRFIMVQLPEECDEKSEARKLGYSVVSEIGKNRIRRAAQKIREEFSETLPTRNTDLDLGFRLLKVDTSNMADVYYAPDALDKANLDLFVDNIKPDRTAEDLLFQVMLDWGVDLALPIAKETIQGKEVFFVDGNALAACFDARSGIDEAFVKELAKRQPLRVVFRDAGFKDSAVKINVEQIFKLLSPATEVKCI
ncbi:site-specific DNA-methyltransferase [Pseudomonas aeruginosa]|uniref:site-specific DNA-methyltransferase n=2 Tax=Pseudomonas aeruginosa TaxID=287 RepID=UPI00053D52DD|nr:site-specific DNA-methyltransferase [Pseudomonas aeruginosa]KSH14296.1 site-specific DNA-methyltransferase [Pseudomonas aeruginosa]MBP8502778.1 site-specific DNA-methyltransferase [Pseudomonas aeruginosa]MBP8521101.1 site-specific DNA-methyltransferase [Pseudomonas aeruginosa]MBX5782731.1 site-specific DNA-methyltransferase [Pseudomonas aeruginosa]MBX6295074.1 site-specific DNA-methyltransferase [Pseudomonas aeruginosa]